MHLFTPHHIALLEACYPSTSVARVDLSPKPQETSRLVYYASNRPEKLQKLGKELEARSFREIAKTRSGSSSGSSKHRNSLLVTLALLKTLAMECRQEISVLTPHLLRTAEGLLQSFPTDLELLARAAGLLTTWCALITGVVITAEEENMTHILNSLKLCGSLCSSTSAAKDDEMCNRKSLIGYAVLFAAVNSSELFRTRNHSQPLLQLVIPIVLRVISRNSLDQLQSRLASIEEDPQAVGYLSEFLLTTPGRKRIPSIYVHVDGKKGPTETDILDACLRIFCVSIQKANAVPLAQASTYIMDYLAEAKLWDNADLCIWITTRSLNWSQYQHRYLLHVKLLERLLAIFPDGGDQPHSTLLRMLHSILSSPIAVANIATSDVLKQLLALLLRLVSSGCSEQVTDWAVICIADLSRHIYYADQIQDLVQEVITKMTTLRPTDTLEVGPGNRLTETVRVQYLCLCLRVLGYFVKAVGQRRKERFPNNPSLSRQISESVKSVSAKTGQVDSAADKTPQEDGDHTHAASISPEIWQPTLGFLVDESFTLQNAYCQQLIAYLQSLEATDLFGSEIIRPPPSSPLVNDVMTRFLHALYANLFMASTGSVVEASPESPQFKMIVGEGPMTNGNAPEESNGAAEHNKEVSPEDSETWESAKQHYTALSRVLTALNTQKRVKTLFVGVPMLIALEGSLDLGTGKSVHAHSGRLTREILTYTWRTIAVAWGCSGLAQQLNHSIARGFTIPDPRPEDCQEGETSSSSVKPELPKLFSPCIMGLAANRQLQESSGLNANQILQCLGSEWTCRGALEASSDQFSLHATNSNIVPLSFIKLSPQLMQVENLSLSSVARSARAIGAGDLREALHGGAGLPDTSIPNRARYESSVSLSLAQQSKRDPGLPVGIGHAHKPSMGRMTDSPDAVQELFASIGLHKEPVPSKLRPRFQSSASREKAGAPETTNR